jgi:hypothetical protein
LCSPLTHTKKTTTNNKPQGSCGFGAGVPNFIAAWPDVQQGYDGICGKCFAVRCRPSQVVSASGATNLPRFTQCRTDVEVVVKIVGARVVEGATEGRGGGLLLGRGEGGHRGQNLFLHFSATSRLNATISSLTKPTNQQQQQQQQTRAPAAATRSGVAAAPARTSTCPTLHLPRSSRAATSGSAF